MTLVARSHMATTANSLQTGRELSARVREGFGEPPLIVLTYMTVNHDQKAVLQGLRESLGESVPLVGCSAQGVVSQGSVREEGYAAGALALGGPGVSVSHAAVDEITENAFEKGRELGKALKAGLGKVPTLVVLHYDALCGVDPERFLDGLYREIECPIVGGAAAHSFNYQSLLGTYCYFGTEVVERSAVAFAIAGVGVEIGECRGCSPVGVEMTVTRAERNKVFELDGRPAASVWSEICGPVTPHGNQSSALALGVPVPDASRPDEYMVRAAYVVDEATGSVQLGPAVTAGTKIMLHHRVVEDVLAGTRHMGEDLARRLNGRVARAVLGFECGARTTPFLGVDGTLEENLALQKKLGSSSAWLGMMPWGEIFPVRGRPTFHNYSYPVAVLTD